jgi:glycosyltransferase 2 family protein
MLGDRRAVLRRTVIALVLSLALGFAGLYLVVGEAVFRPETYRVRNAGVPVVLLIVVAFLAKWLSPAVRIGLLCRGQKIPFSYRSALLVHLVAMFVAALAPQNTGFGPATVAALRRLGVPVGRGIGVAVQVFLLDLVFFAWAVPASIGYLDLSNTFELPPGATLVAFVAACLAILIAVVLSRRPQLVVSLILALARWQLLARFASRLRKVARDYHGSARAFLMMPASYWITLHLATAASWFGGFVLLWALMRLYGVEFGLLTTLAILSSLTLVSHIVPTPGGSGFVEAAVGFGLGANPGGGAAAALLVWRLASFYVIFVLGPLAGWLLYLSPPVAAPRETGCGKDTRGGLV